MTCRNDGFGTVDATRYRPNDPTTLIGTVFQDRYRVDALLGSGGMGSVYRATQIRVGRQVALKVINAELAFDLAVVARFQREGRAIASLIHPNIVGVFDFGQSDEGQLFMAMELVNGRTLAQVIADDAPVDPVRIVHVGAQIFDALAEAHEHGVIHRDLKPENIFITETGRRKDVVKILDFGVAKIVNEPKSESMVTARGAILGSPKYMAPEQARGKGVTGHADIYAVGGILYEMLTGRAVFNEPSPADYLVAHSVKMPSPPEAKGSELRGPLVDLIMKCLEKKPWNRPDGASRALEALEACRTAPVVTGAAEVKPSTPRKAPSRRTTQEPPRRLQAGAETQATYAAMPVINPSSMPPIPSSPPPVPAAPIAARTAARQMSDEVPTAITKSGSRRRTPPKVAAVPSLAEMPAVVGQKLPAPLTDRGSDRPQVTSADLVKKTASSTAAKVAAGGAAAGAAVVGAKELLVANLVETEAKPVETKGPVVKATGNTQDDPTAVTEGLPASTSLGMKTIDPAALAQAPAAPMIKREEERKRGAFWPLAIAILIFGGLLAYLAVNNFFMDSGAKRPVAGKQVQPSTGVVASSTVVTRAGTPSAEEAKATEAAKAAEATRVADAKRKEEADAKRKADADKKAKALTVESSPTVVAGATKTAKTVVGAAKTVTGATGVATGTTGVATGTTATTGTVVAAGSTAVGSTVTTGIQPSTPGGQIVSTTSGAIPPGAINAGSLDDPPVVASTTTTTYKAPARAARPTPRRATRRRARPSDDARTDNITERLAAGSGSPTVTKKTTTTTGTSGTTTTSGSSTTPKSSGGATVTALNKNAVFNRVTVESAPPGATLYMGATKLGTTPLQVEWEDIGRPITITLKKTGFKATRTTLSSKSRKTKRVTMLPQTQLDKKNQP